MRLLILFLSIVISGILLLSYSDSSGFGEIAGSCEKDCQKCHQITMTEASGILNSLAPNIEVEVLDVQQSPVRGLWEVSFKMQGRVGVIYLDFSKSNMIEGQIIELKTKTSLTGKKISDLRAEFQKADVSKIPLDEALVIGDKDAKYKVIVFTDPA